MKFLFSHHDKYETSVKLSTCKFNILCFYRNLPHTNVDPYNGDVTVSHSTWRQQFTERLAGKRARRMRYVRRDDVENRFKWQ